ncbi:MAG: tRNA (adenosine(37)-N6)-threonylcarbamoyltransferase complex dimerization subunit type 1 TsaB, partial [Chloroflexota bacterium]
MILAIDTATRWLGVAIHDGTAVLAESGWRCLNNHTTELADAIQALMARAKMEPNDLTGIAVAIGPGSYTGLRVGLAMAKGFALVHQIPLLAVSTLDVVAIQVPPTEGRLIAIAEAGRTRVCMAEYEWLIEKGWQPSGDPDIKTWQTILTETSGPTLFAGEISEKTAVQ